MAFLQGLGGTRPDISAPISQRSERGDITLENKFVRYTFGADGRNLNFIDKQTGKDYCVQEPTRYFVSLQKEGRLYQPSAFAVTRGRIAAEFQRATVTVELKVGIHDDYFTIEVASIAGEGVEKVEKVTLSDLQLNIVEHLGTMANVAWNNEFAAGVMALNLQANAASQSTTRALLWSACYPKTGLKGAKIGVIGCPLSQFRSAIQRMFKQEGIVYSEVGGAWAMEAEENRYSYLFAGVTESNVDEWMDLAKTAGITELLLYSWGPVGHYIPRIEAFPSGLAGVKAVVDKIHAAGLRAGWHMNSFLISKDDPWVTPVPDKRLAKRATLTLAAPIADDATFIPTVESPKDLPTQPGYWFRGGTDVLVDEEIITYAGLATQPPYGLTGCQRGSYKTKAAAHQTGAALHNLQKAAGMFLPDGDSTLLDEMAQHIADIINTCGFDLIYFDALDLGDLLAGKQWQVDWRWHYASKFALSVLKQTRGRVRVEASIWLHHIWPIHSRLGAWDHPVRDPKKFIDIHSSGNLFYAANLLPTQLGWWALHSYLMPVYLPDRVPPLYFATSPDVIEYLCTKCIGYDSPLSLQQVAPADLQNPHRKELLSIIGRYESLRLSGSVPESIKAQLRVPGHEFTLKRDRRRKWQFQPVEYAEHKVTALDGSSNVWTVTNQFRRQKPRFRIQALLSAQAYDALDTGMLADFVDVSEFAANKASASGMSHDLVTSTVQVKAGTASGCFTATSNRVDPRGSWVRVSKQFSPLRNMEKIPALGVWIYGDAKGEVLNLQLLDSRVSEPLVGKRNEPAVGEHYIIVDFVGWRYFELIEPEGKRWSDYEWPYGNTYAVYREDVEIRNIKWLNLYINNVPPGETVTCYLSPIKALQVDKVKLENPQLTIGRHTIRFPVTLESGNYLEFHSLRDCKLYDPNGRFITPVMPEGDIPTLASGENLITFTCDPLRDHNPRAMVTTISNGSPLR